ncbi:glycosyl hydrolase [Apiospora arundinis]
MGALEDLAGPLVQQFSQLHVAAQVGVLAAAFLFLSIFVHIANQILFKNPNEPPMVFSWVNREKYGDIFTFILLGKKTTVYVGCAGNDFILNGKAKDVCAEDIYTVLTTPVFGKDVVYDCPNSKLMEQKKFMKIALTTQAFQSYVPIIADEMAQITIFTASHSLQGKEIRHKFDETLADLYHDLDMGFSPVNFMLHWAPLPWNNRRDHAQRTIAKIYMDTIKERRAAGKSDAQDMMWHLMNSTYKNGTPVPDHEIAHMMIALLMAGQHSSSSTSSWIMLWLAARPDIMEDLYREQVEQLGADLPPLHHVLLSAGGVTATDPTFFPDPDTWEPHRWDKDSPIAPRMVVKSEEEEEKIDYGYGLVSKGAASPYLPFGAGRHRCIGEQFANVQLQTITAMVVREFKFRNVDGSNKVIGTDYASLFSRPLEPANIHWEKRDA